RAEPEGRQQLVLALAQVQRDGRAALGHLHRLERVLAPAVGLPADAFAGPLPAGGDRHPLGHDEAGVEAHAELADECRVPALVAGQGRQELPGARFGDRADVVDDLRPAHADPVVGHADRAGRGVVRDPYPQRPAGLRRLTPRQQLDPQPVDRVGGVRDQLPEKYLLVAVQGMDHEVEDLHDLGLETEPFRRLFRRHGAQRTDLRRGPPRRGIPFSWDRFTAWPPYLSDLNAGDYLARAATACRPGAWH